jgi:hypothetical protein
MIRSKLGLLGLCVVVLGVMAFSASAAQAEVGAKWLILETPGGVVKDAAVLLAALGGTLENNTGSLLTKVLGIAVEILCVSLTPKAFHLEKEGSVDGKLHFDGCLTKLNGVLNTNCKPKTAGAPEGLIETAALKGLLILHELAGGAKDKLVRLEPLVGETFATLNMGAACPIGELIPVRGKFVIKDCKELLLEHKVAHLAEEGPLTDLWVLNKTAEHAAKLDGSTNLFLSGAHEGKEWGGDV